MVSNIFFPFILVFGSITSYEDIRCGKIRNKYILLAFIFAVLMNSLMFSGFIENHSLSQDYYPALLINVIIAFLVSYSLWTFKMWTAGDAKLFSAYAALIPLTTYRLGYVEYFPSFTILGNTFIPLFFLLLLTLPFSIKEKIQPRKVFDLKTLAGRILFLFGFLWFFDGLFSFMGMQLTFLTYLLLFMAIPEAFRKTKFITLTQASILFSVLRLLFDYDTVLTMDFLRFFASLIFVFMVVMFLISLSRLIKTTTSIRIDELKPCMMLAEDIKSENKVIINLGRGVTQKEIDLINRLYKEKKLESDHVRIQQTLPFAPFLFFGVLLTYLCQGDLITFIRILLKI
ncbi:MAG: hypothetical protein JW778_01085 [Candidatus Altiarchaeota archaeon]|nr:hypothetical protein [Candidatus Altiarchaeota archaeon]